MREQRASMLAGRVAAGSAAAAAAGPRPAGASALRQRGWTAGRSRGRAWRRRRAGGAPSPTSLSTVSRAWRTTLPMPFRSTKRSRLGRASCSSAGRATRLNAREQVVEHHVEAEPGGVGAELLARQRLGRQLVGQHVVGVLDRAGLAALPADQVEPVPPSRIGPVGDDREVLDLAAVGEQPALLLADAADQIARRHGPVLGGHPVARHVRHLGPMPDRIAVLALELPGLLGQRAGSPPPARGSCRR